MANLPTGYTELEYIESTGTQWIDTGRKPTQDSVVELKFQITINDESTYAVCGSRNASTGASGAFGLFKINSSRFDAYIGGQVKRVSAPANDVHTVLMTGKSVSFDGSETAISASDFTGNYTFLICAMNQLNGVDSRRASMRIYYAKGVIESDFNLVPCLSQIGEVGLYDTSEKVFYRSAGPDEFLPGPEVPPPETPTSFFQSASVVLRWSPVECDGYRLYKNGSILTETTETLYIDDAVSNGQDIEYSITAYRGNLESEPQTITVQVREGYTILTPVITSAFFQ